MLAAKAENTFAKAKGPNTSKTPLSISLKVTSDEKFKNSFTAHMFKHASKNQFKEKKSTHPTNAK